MSCRSWFAALPLLLPASVAHALPASGLQADWRADQGVATDGSGNVTTWTDASPNARVATSVAGRLPVLVAANAEVGGEPTLRFTSDQLNFDGSFLANTDYTVFSVAGRSGTGPANFVFAGQFVSGRTSNMLVLGYENATTLRLSQFGGDVDLTVPANGPGREWNLDSGVFASGVGKTVIHNGGARSTGSVGPITRWDGARIGGGLFDVFYFSGDIAELVIYDRALSCAERIAVEEELATRWSVAAWSTTDDDDGDGVCDVDDQCLGDDATGDTDGDGVCGDLDVCLGDDVTGDDDADGVCDLPLCATACVYHLPGGDATDSDCDGWLDGDDNCLTAANPAQTDDDGDLLGDACDPCVGGDPDGDGLCSREDNCDFVANAGQEDADHDAEGDACDVCETACAYHVGGGLVTDTDCDGWLDPDDGCVTEWDPTNACGS